MSDDEYHEALFEIEDRLDSWPMLEVRSQMKPHEKETLDEIISSVAKRMLAQMADQYTDQDCCF